MKKLLLILLVFSSISYITYSQQNNNKAIYIEDKAYNWGNRYEWIIFSPDNSIFYNLDVNNNGNNKLLITTYDEKFNSISEEINNIKIGKIIRIKGNVVSIDVNGKIYSIPEEFYPKNTISGFLNIKWGESFNNIVNILEKDGYKLEKINEKMKDYLYKSDPVFYPELIKDMSEIELNAIVQNIKIESEYLDYPVVYNFNFYEGKFYNCNISFVNNNSENDFKKIIDNLIREYGKPDHAEKNIYVWFFDFNYSISATLSSLQISLRYEDYKV
jgi:hypothetical protein